jgi:hypothetical protein
VWIYKGEVFDLAASQQQEAKEAEREPRRGGERQTAAK